MKKKIFVPILTLTLTGILVFSGYQIYKIISEYESGERTYDDLVDQQRSNAFLITAGMRAGIISIRPQLLCSGKSLLSAMYAVTAVM